MIQGYDVNENAGKLYGKLKKLLKIGQTYGYWSHGYDFPHRCKQVFNGTDFSNKNVLEIGCGKGLFCVWASLHGARKVVGLEPLDEGSFDSSEIFREFKEIAGGLGLRNIDLIASRIQDYQDRNNFFDIVLSVASINHLDEDSCVILQNSEIAQKKYKQIFSEIADQMKEGGKLIILDCSNRNFFPAMGLRNPMEKTIEWAKHQTPELWVELLSECGFEAPKISWLAGRFLRHMRVYNRNKLFSYFVDSTFRLEMTCAKKNNVSERCRPILQSKYKESELVKI